MFKRITALTALLAVTAGATSVGAETESSPQAQQATVVSKTIRKPPKRITRVVKFTPWATPTASYVHYTILPYEAMRAGVSYEALRRRVYCESKYQWNVNNGQYNGIGQFASSTFYRGLRTIGSNRVRMVQQVVKYRRSVVTRRWSDGRIDRWKGRRWPVKVTRILKGRFAYAYLNPWAQARIMAQAIAGRSAVHDSEWQCR